MIEYLLLRETRRVEWGSGVKMWQIRISYRHERYSSAVPVGVMHVLYRVLYDYDYEWSMIAPLLICTRFCPSRD